MLFKDHIECWKVNESICSYDLECRKYPQNESYLMTILNVEKYTEAFVVMTQNVESILTKNKKCLDFVFFLQFES